jgi:choice-of-anchor B domain-containing protein
MQRLLLLLICGLNLCSALPAQNLNTTFRSSMTFPTQTLANVWGYVGRDGKEYALLGGQMGMIIVDVSNPDAPQEIVRIPGPNNLWKEIKTYSHYAYIVSEGGLGIQVVNLKGLPSPNLPSHYYRGDGVINNQLNRIHALHIDVKKGFLYAWGGNLFGGGAKVFDLKQDPYNPKYVGKYDQLGYIHDGIVDNDTMYSSHIYAGYFAVVNMADKNAPELIATQTTPNAFPHNTWLSDDHKTLFSTDEVPNSFLTSFDISDPLDIKQLDKIQSNPGSNSAVHNTYTLKNWAVTSWYKDGFTIVDITRPDNLVQVGNYDTYLPSGEGFDGCWGVYPYFPSGNIIASNIPIGDAGNGKMFVITPNYRRACYLEGKITNAITGFPLNNASIEVLGSNPLTKESSGSNGVYKTGQAASGYYTVRVSKAGYHPYETSVLFEEGEVVALNAALYPIGNITVTGSVLRQNDNQPVAGASVILNGINGSSTTATDASGVFLFPNVAQGLYNVIASAPGVGMGALLGQSITADTDLTVYLTEIFRREALRVDVGSAAVDQAVMTAENPFVQSSLICYTSPETGSMLYVTNSAGQIMLSECLEAQTGTLEIGQNFPPGFYFVRMESEGKLLQTLKLLKTQ